MLIPKRVIEDNGLHLYRLPYEAAIFPQTAYQLGLAVEHAAGFPDSGKRGELGTGDVAADSSGGGSRRRPDGKHDGGDGRRVRSPPWGFIRRYGTSPVVPTRWGDLATVAACLLCPAPRCERPRIEAPYEADSHLSGGVYCQNQLKFQLSPWQEPSPSSGSIALRADLGRKNAVGIALAVWSAFYTPIILWTTLQCGSPLGLAGATLFHSRYFGADAIEQIKVAKDLDPKGLMPLLRWLAPSVSWGMIARIRDRRFCRNQARAIVHGGQRTRLRAGHSDCLAFATAIQIPRRTSIRRPDPCGVGHLAIPARGVGHQWVVGGSRGTVPPLGGGAGLLCQTLRGG